MGFLFGFSFLFCWGKKCLAMFSTGLTYRILLTYSMHLHPLPPQFSSPKLGVVSYMGKLISLLEQKYREAVVASWTLFFSVATEEEGWIMLGSVTVNFNPFTAAAE